MRFRDLVHAAENKYNRLLTILVLIYFFSPFLADLPLGNLAIFFVFFGAIALVAYQIYPRPKMLKIHFGLVLFALLLRGISYSPLTPLDFRDFLDVFSTIILLAFFALSIYLMLKELTIAEQVTADLIKGGICVYFLLGFFWATMYGLVYQFDANAFNAVYSTITRSDLTHFSFTTLTTVGYGDISPISDIARVLANLEGMAGVMYPAVFIARLVSLQSNH